MTIKQILNSPPQWVCFIRLAAQLTALLIFQTQPYISISLLVMAELLDMLDGYLARKYNATSAFGTIADMVIDRLTPILCFSMLISLHPKWGAIFALLLALDLLGHMAMLYSALLMGNLTHHKKLFSNINPLLNLYYAPTGVKRFFMVSTIVFYDLALATWLIHFLNDALVPSLLLWSITALGTIKVYIHVLHLYYSFKLTLPESTYS